MSFVQFAQEKDAASFKQHFEDAIQAAISSALEDEKIAIAQSMFGEQSDDEDEEVYEDEGDGEVYEEGESEEE